MEYESGIAVVLLSIMLVVFEKLEMGDALKGKFTLFIGGFILCEIMVVFASIQGTNTILYLCVLFILYISAVSDTISLKVPINYTISLLPLMLVKLLMLPQEEMFLYLAEAVMFTLLLFMVQRVSRGAIGLGDVILMGMMSGTLGARTGMIIFVISLGLSGVIGALSLKKRHRLMNKKIPFTPFVLISFFMLMKL